VTYRELRTAIRKVHRAGWSYRKIADHFGVSHSVIHKIAVEGYKPKQLEIRQRLGLVRKVTRWDAISKEDLLWAIENRKEVSSVDS